MQIYRDCIHDMSSQGHEFSIEKRETTVINLEAHPDLAALYRATVQLKGNLTPARG